MSKGKLNIVNRDEFKSFVNSPVSEYQTPIRVKSVKLEKISHDKKYAESKKRGDNIDITSDEIYVNGKKPIDGIFSPLFGMDATVETPIYSCECHQLTGASNAGRICPNCGFEVKTIEADLRLTGYIDIAPYHILSFHGYNAMKKVFKNFDSFIETVRRINKAGKVIKDDKPTLLELYNDYDDEYLLKTGLPKDIAFMSKIPVYSSRLRPLMTFGSNHLSMLDVNVYYMSIVKLANELRTSSLIPGLKREVEVQRLLNEIQKNFNLITTFCLEQIKGKYGALRRSLASGRLDYSSRMVISAGVDLKPNEVDVPYQTMMVLYEEEIANRLSRLMDISLSKAISIVEESTVEANEMCVSIINQMLKSKNGIWVLINRNPTISESGIMYVRIRKINDDLSDYTMHMPPDILPLMAADFNVI